MSSTVDRRVGWLADLKVGDQVVVARDRHGQRMLRSGHVMSITPTGRIRVHCAGDDHESSFTVVGSAVAPARGVLLEPTLERLVQVQRSKLEGSYIELTTELMKGQSLVGSFEQATLEHEVVVLRQVVVRLLGRDVR